MRRGRGRGGLGGGGEEVAHCWLGTWGMTIILGEGMEMGFLILM